MGTAVASLGLIVGFGAGVGTAAPGAEAQPGSVDGAPATAGTPAEAPAERGGCDLGVMVDTYDHEPTVYGGSWLNCYDWAAYTGWLRVDLYRDGVHQGQGFCQLNQQMNCDAGMSAGDPSGDQVWKACASYEVHPHPVAPWRLTGSECATGVS